MSKIINTVHKNNKCKTAEYLGNYQSLTKICHIYFKFFFKYNIQRQIYLMFQC